MMHPIFLYAALWSVAIALVQSLPNDLSTLGTLDAPRLPEFLSDGPMFQGTPWGDASPAGRAPNTGKIRRYEFTISRSYARPDGFNKSVILINNQFPGPTIEANWGDTIEVKVTNNIITDMREGVSLHWHGLFQSESPWMDGVPGVSQCPIAPGGTFTYSFRADRYGTSWYHSHYASQYSDGLYGAMVIHGPRQPGVEYDEDLGPLLLADYLHSPYYKVTQDIYHIPPIFPNVDNNFINGRGLIDCSFITDGTPCDPNAGLSRFKIRRGKTYRLRLINASGAASQKFTIDNHEMTVFANDFVPVRPYRTKVVTLGTGQRTDVLLRATGNDKDAVWMRSDIDLDCLNLTTTNSHALGAVYYNNANLQELPKTPATPWQSNRCRNDPLAQTEPFWPQSLSPNPATTQLLEISLGLNSSGNVVFFVNGSSFRTNYDHPVLLLAKNGNTSYPDSPQWNIQNFGSNSSVRMIWRNTYEQQHPMHLHGHDFYVLAEGIGEWDGKITRPKNPQRRDVHVLQPGTPEIPSYAVFEWEQDNPGVWPFHCHTAIHVSAGLYINIIERPEDIKKLPVPMIMAQSCRDWAKFSGTEVVNQIDSGLKY